MQAVEEDDALAPRQAAFVEQYLLDLNATQAAIRAGYSPNGAAVTGSQLLSLPNVAKAVERGKAQRAIRVGVTQEHILSEMALLANSRIDHYFVTDEGQVRVVEGAPDGAMAAIQSINRRTTVKYDKDGQVIGKVYDVSIKLWDKPNPLKLMGRHVGLFPDRTELTGPNGGPIETVNRVERVIVDPKKSDG
jgi:phage terminase small subunit